MNSSKRVPYEVIKAAMECDENALQYIMEFYYPTIKAMAIKSCIDIYGEYNRTICNDLIADIESRLVMAIIKDFRFLHKP